jgi:glycine dehydrogenase subunit 1
MRYTPNTPEQRAEMLRVCGVSSIGELFRDIPKSLRPRSFNLPAGRSELEVYQHFHHEMELIRDRQRSFMGGGFYDHYIPSAVDELAGRGEFYTAYTPYQPEASQGTLQAIYEYQTHICRLTGMEVSNASLYDGGTAVYEACQMALRATDRHRIIVAGGVNPIYRKMLLSFYAASPSVEVAEVHVAHGRADRDKLFAVLDENVAAVVLQNPNFFSVIDDQSDIVARCHRLGILVIQSVYPVAMALLKTPGEIGADIAVGEGQSLGIPLSFGGPYLGFLATTAKLARKMPGRVVGRTVDRNGKDAFVLTLQAREQHIRREKATSNICTNAAMCALRACIYMSLMGAEGLREVARLCMAKASYAKNLFEQVKGIDVMRENPTFNEFVLRLPGNAADLTAAMARSGLSPGIPLGRFYPDMDRYLLVAVTETKTERDIRDLVQAVERAICR